MPSWCTLISAGDQIYLFGFSRGAYTVRVLAGLIHKIGLITPEQVNLAGSGLIAYKQFSSDEAPKLRAGLKSLADVAAAEDTLPQSAVRQRRAVRAHHLDALADHPLRRRLGYGGERDRAAGRPVLFAEPGGAGVHAVNPSVQTFRQAISIDERRCMFRLKKWEDPQTFKHNRFNDAHAEPQDILQVWFAGVHADIGGGYPEKQSGLSKYPLLWMIDEADQMRPAGQPAPPSTSSPGASSARAARSPMSRRMCAAMLHVSLSGAWWLLEYLPKSAKYREWPERQVYYGWYIPDGEPRLIPDGAWVHESALLRMDALPGYRPVNLPKQYEKFPMPVAPAHASAELEEDA